LAPAFGAQVLEISLEMRDFRRRRSGPTSPQMAEIQSKPHGMTLDVAFDVTAVGR
jgi:hypothetical protein